MSKLFPTTAAALIVLSCLTPTARSFADGTPKPAPVAAKQEPSPEQSKAIHESFARLRAALKKADGKTATSLVTQNTLRLYDEARQLALSPVDLDSTKQGEVRILMALQFRYLRTRAQLQKATGASLFEWGVKSGLITDETFSELALDTMQLDGTQAVATVKRGADQVPDMRFFFSQEKGTWRLDMVPIVLLAEKQLADLRAHTGKSKTQFAIEMLEGSHKKKMPPEILKGPVK